MELEVPEWLNGEKAGDDLEAGQERGSRGGGPTRRRFDLTVQMFSAPENWACRSSYYDAETEKKDKTKL